MEIIVLKGSSNCGKTQTLNIAYQLLLHAGYKQVTGHYGEPETRNFLGVDITGNRDFYDILSLNGKVIGLTTGENDKEALEEILADFAKAGCTKAICACTDDYDSMGVIKKYAKHTFIDKTTQPVDSLKRIDDGAFAEKIVALV